LEDKPDPAPHIIDGADENAIKDRESDKESEQEKRAKTPAIYGYRLGIQTLVKIVDAKDEHQCDEPVESSGSNREFLAKERRYDGEPDKHGKNAKHGIQIELVGIRFRVGGGDVENGSGDDKTGNYHSILG
jgi:hypothetical protein